MRMKNERQPLDFAQRIVLLLGGLMALPCQASVLLAVDLGQEPQDVEPGFTDGSAAAIAVFEPQPFAGGTWDIDSNLALAARNYGNIPTTPGGALLEDSILANQNASDPDFYFEIVLDELTPGSYTLTTYHHSYAFGGASARVSGGADSASLVVLGTITSTSGTDISGATVSSVDFITTAEEDGYTLRFTPIDAAGSFHFDLSGFELTGTIDSDGDGITDTLDNCVTYTNADQTDTDTDGLGNACDPDHDQNCAVNFADLALLKAEFFGANPGFDYTGDGAVNFLDLARIKQLFFMSPGPSSVPNLCEGS